MSYFATGTCDLKNAIYDYYKAAYSDLKHLGLSHVVVSSDGREITLPTKMTAGSFSSGSAGSLRDELTDKIKNAFNRRGFASETFVTVGGDWAWSHRIT